MQRVQKLIYKGRAPRIGIFDDDEATVDMLARYFQHHGFEVLTARDGKGSLAAVVDAKPEARPDVVILDVMMPDMDGFDVASRMRKADPLIPIIMFSARVDQQDKIRGLMTGAHRYITKPSSPMKLLEEAIKLIGLSMSEFEADGRDTNDSETLDLNPEEVPPSIRDLPGFKD